VETALQLRVDAAAAAANLCWYGQTKMTAGWTPAIDTLERARDARRTATAWLQPLGYAVIAFVLIDSLWPRPHSAFHGDRAAQLAALAAFAIATVVLIRRGALSKYTLLAAFSLLILGSAALVWLLPGGSGFFGMFLAVSIAPMRLRARPAVAVAATALAAVAVAGAFSGHSSFVELARNELGGIAFFLVAMLADRMRAGQEEAEKLVAELERTRDAEARAAALAERTRVAREMHDVLSHSLSGLALQLAAARVLAEKQGADPALGEALERAHHLAKAGMDEARHATGMLREEALPGPERLPVLAEELERDAGVPCQVDVTGEPRSLSAEARLTLYRVAQEALTNIRKHAQPRRVAVRLAYQPDGTRLTVEDFGDGGAPPPGDASGYGLTGMRERAELLGGTLAAAPTQSGFRVDLWVPA